MNNDYKFTNNKSKKRTIILIVFIALLIAGITVFICIPKIDKSNYISLINHNWNVDFPYCDEKIYYVDNNSNSPLGDGDRYSVLKYSDEEKIKKLNKMNWSKTLDKENIEKISAKLDKLEIPKNMKIDYSKELSYQLIYRNNSEMMVVAYDTENNQLYVFEHFI